MKEVLLIKAQQQSLQKDFYRDLMLKLNTSSTQTIFVKNYKIKFFRSDYTYMLEYLCKVSFLTTLDIYIYINYFKDRYKGCKVIIHAYCDRRQKLL